MPAINLGRVVLSSSQLQIDDSGDLFMEYYTNSSSQSTECVGRGMTTTVRFRCPSRQLVSLTCFELHNVMVSLNIFLSLLYEHCVLSFCSFIFI